MFQRYTSTCSPITDGYLYIYEKNDALYYRNKENELPPSTPTTAAEPVLPDKFKLTHKSESFVLFDNEDRERIIIQAQSTGMLQQSFI